MILKKFNNASARKYQDGGAMAAPVEAPVEEGMPVEEGAAPAEQGADPLMQLAEIFAQGLQAQDCNMLAQGAQAFLEMIQQSMGGAQQPMFRKGGRLIRK